MASASKTPNLNLPQWVGTEKLERTDFNAAFDAIDTTVASHLAEDVTQGNPHGINAKVSKAWGNEVILTLENGWYGDLACKKNDLGEVWLYGSIAGGVKTQGTVVTTLPVGYSPELQGVTVLATDLTLQKGYVPFYISVSGRQMIVRATIGAGTSNVISIIFKSV